MAYRNSPSPETTPKVTVTRDFIPSSHTKHHDEATTRPELFGRGKKDSSYQMYSDADLVAETINPIKRAGSYQTYQPYRELSDKINELNHELTNTTEQVEYYKTRLKTAESDLVSWRSYGNEVTDRLSRTNSQNGKNKNPAELFYDAGIKRTINELVNENRILTDNCGKLSSETDVKNLVITKEVLKNQVSNLKQQLEVKFSENQRLKKNIKDYVAGDREELLKDKESAQTKIAQLRTELIQVKSYLFCKHELTEYLKTLFESIKNDLIKLFTKHYLMDREKFISALEKSDSEDDIPDFLKQPLDMNKEIQTDISCDDNQEEIRVEKKLNELSIKSENIDDRIDSGVGQSITDEQRDLMNTSRDLHLEKIKNSESEKKLSEMMQERDMYKKQFHDQENEVASWKTALKSTHDEAGQFRQENAILKDEKITLEVQIKDLQRQVPYHTDTVNLIEENNELKAKLKTMEEINQNLHVLISGKRPGERLNPLFQKSYSADTQVQSRQSRPYEWKHTPQNSEYFQNAREQEFNQPQEPWQTHNNPWMNPSMHTSLIATDGPSYQRKSVSPVSSSHDSTKRVSESPTSISHYENPTETRTVASNNEDWRSSSVQRDWGQSSLGLRNFQRPTVEQQDWHQSPAETMSSLERSLHQQTFKCQHCGRYLPSKEYWSHIRTCAEQLDE